LKALVSERVGLSLSGRGIRTDPPYPVRGEESLKGEPVCPL